MQPEPTVFVVDDDEAVRNSLQWLIQSVGLRVETYASAADFLKECDPNRPGCLIADVRLPGMSGLELHERLAQEGRGLPVIIITGHGDVPMAVRAMKAGAVDFVEKPFSDQVLLDQVQSAIQMDTRARLRRAEGAEIARRLARLSPREREVLDMVVAGKSSKQIARELSLAGKTVEAHRARIMDKMRAESVAHLVRQTMFARLAEGVVSPGGDGV